MTLEKMRWSVVVSHLKGIEQLRGNERLPPVENNEPYQIHCRVVAVKVIIRIVESC